MKARDVMVSPVVTVMPHCSVKELAQTLLKNHISAVPVVDDQGRLVRERGKSAASLGSRDGTTAIPVAAADDS